MIGKNFGFLAIVLIISAIPAVSAQIEIGEKAVQRSVEVSINPAGDVHVIHVIDSSNQLQYLELIEGTVSNITVTDEQKEEIQFIDVGGSNRVSIFPSQEDSIVEYDLEQRVAQTDDGIWTWNFRYLEKTVFIFPDKVDLIFIDERPVYFEEKRTIACHGCQMVLEYTTDEPRIFENVKWEDREFVVEIETYSDVDKFVFDQPAKSITFDVNSNDNYVIVVIPLELLWQPYGVFVDGKKTFSHEYTSNGTHVWLSMKPDTAGEVMIIGTTVIPEFPIIAPLAIGFLTILALPLIRKFNLR